MTRGGAPVVRAHAVGCTHSTTYIGSPCACALDHRRVCTGVLTGASIYMSVAISHSHPTSIKIAPILRCRWLCRPEAYPVALASTATGVHDETMQSVRITMRYGCVVDTVFFLQQRIVLSRSCVSYSGLLHQQRVMALRGLLHQRLAIGKGHRFARPVFFLRLRLWHPDRLGYQRGSPIPASAGL